MGWITNVTPGREEMILEAISPTCRTCFQRHTGRLACPECGVVHQSLYAPAQPESAADAGLQEEDSHDALAV